MTSAQFLTNDCKGLSCPACGGRKLRVLYTRCVEGARLHRRRECRDCGHRITTYEKVAR